MTLSARLKDLRSLPVSVSSLIIFETRYAELPRDIDDTVPGHDAGVVTLGITENALRVRLQACQSKGTSCS